MTWLATICGMFFNTFVNPIALERIAWRYYIVFIVVLLVFGLTAYFYYPETKGYTLEQVAVIFDGPDALVANTAEVATAAEAKTGPSAVHNESV